LRSTKSGGSRALKTTHISTVDMNTPEAIENDKGFLMAQYLRQKRKTEGKANRKRR